MILIMFIPIRHSTCRYLLDLIVPRLKLVFLVCLNVVFPVSWKSGLSFPEFSFVERLLRSIPFFSCVMHVHIVCHSTLYPVFAKFRRIGRTVPLDSLIIVCPF
uniref:Uncharacterized protein n=1 Tax=Cacopsylla melanoneura TaxID=428564 RepID=A0A8D8WIK9_9HEMI